VTPIELNPVSAWLKPRSRWLVWPVLLLGFAVSFGAGAVLAPQQPVEVRTEFIEIKAKTETKQKAKTKERYVKVVIEPSGRRTEETSEREVSKAETVRTETSSSTLVTASTPVQKSWSVGAIVAATWKEPTPAPSAVTVGAMGDLRLGKTPCFAGGVALLELRAGAVTQGSLGVTGRCEF
jgi:hypothetical protein